MQTKYELEKILIEMGFNKPYKILGDGLFDDLALVDYNVDFKLCTYVNSSKYLEKLKNNTSVLITKPGMIDFLDNSSYSICLTENPEEMYFAIHNYLAKKSNKRQYYKNIIHPTAKISKLSSIADSNVEIGENVIIEEFVVIRENTKIGDNSIIRSGSIIGGEGFQFKKINGEIELISHIGGVKIGKNVEIQQNTCIDRAIYSWDDTVIGDGTKIDNLVHVAHGVKIGENSKIVTQSCLGGRVVIGNDAWIGIGAKIRNGLTIGNNARVNMGAVVTKDVLDGESVTGNFAIDHQKFMGNLKKIIKSESEF